jgi:hypothetical protein
MHVEVHNPSQIRLFLINPAVHRHRCLVVASRGALSFTIKAIPDQSWTKAMKIITLIIVMMTTVAECFVMKPMGLKRALPIVNSRLQMAITLPNIFSTLPLCDNKFLSGPSAPRSIVDDPTAGMSPGEIQNYMDNVGGGMCGFPESVKTIVGVTLNLSLISFGIFTVSYIVLYAIQGFLNKQVEDTIADADKGNSVAGAPMLSALTGEGTGKFDFSASMEAKAAKDGEGTSRKERRLREKVKGKDADK